MKDAQQMRGPAGQASSHMQGRVTTGKKMQDVMGQIDEVDPLE
jgi:hypothetical protein